jgi:hypothetical protein
MTSRYLLIIGDDVFCRGDKQGDWSDHYLPHLMTCRNAKTSYRLKSIHGHTSHFSLILVGLDWERARACHSLPNNLKRSKASNVVE